MKAAVAAVFTRHLGALFLAASAISAGWVHAAPTDIASEPLFTTVNKVIKPNLLFVLDNSGSMAWDFMPDDADFNISGFNTVYGRRAMQCNGLAYSPTTEYALPVDATGANVSNASTGFLSGTAVSGVNYLPSGNVSYTRTRHSLSDMPSTNVVNSGSVVVTLSASQPENSVAADSYFVGKVVTLYGSTSGNARYMIGKVSAWVPASQVLTIDVAMGVGVGNALTGTLWVASGSPIDNVYYTYSGSQTALDFKYPGNVLETGSAFYKECNSTIGSDPGKPVFNAVIVTPGSAEAQKYANWYYYYSTRMLMMKTSLSLAFKGIDDRFRVGLSTINGEASSAINLDIVDFGDTQKTTFYSRFNAAVPSGSTPLRAALSKAGRYYAKKLSGQTDPVQYSCQKNYTILSTDGYWNSSAGYQLDGTTAVGQQDGGTTPRPMYDGQATTVTVTTPFTVVRYQTWSRPTTVTSVWRRYDYSLGAKGAGGCSASRYPLYRQEQRRTETRVDITSKEQKVTGSYTQTVVTVNGVAQAPTVSTTTWGAAQDLTSATTVTGTSSFTDWANNGSNSFQNCQSDETLPSPDPSTPTRISGPSSSNGSSTTTTTSTADPVAGASTTTSGSTGGSSNSLADVAMYYYQTDLRTSDLGNCTGALGKSVCENNADVRAVGEDTAAWQHMTTFTLSLGMNGTLAYTADYPSNPTGDFAALKSGNKNWPVPSSDGGPVNIDDLWHAAVNGRGRYFSAKDPATLQGSLSAALNSVGKAVGAASSAATSTLQPVLGDDGVFIAQFMSQEWSGDLESYGMNTTTGAVIRSKTDAATGKDVSAIRWSAKAMLTKDWARKIHYLNTSTGALADFSYATMSADVKAHFDNACGKSPALSQCSGLAGAALDAVNSGANMVSFLRGQDQAQYRVRTSILGDIVSSSPVYVRRPSFNYSENGYAAFKAAQADRLATVYVGANDGMLHAFNAENGTERWAYVPNLVMNKLYRLADAQYASKHLFTVDGTPTVGDVYDKAAGTWRTILVGGLNAGGSGYYALDVTNPEAPKALWEFTNANLGLSYGNPVITKRKDGNWVVAFTSGHNNADGDGHLFVVNALTGQLLKDIKTGAGSAGSPSGLSKLNAWIDADADNTATRFYAGDLLGNIWRFDIDDVTEPKNSAFKLAQLLVGGVPQPITTQLQLAEIVANGAKHAVVYAGTGRYLGASDVSDKSVQSIYAIKDALGVTSLGDVRGGGSLVKQTLSSDATFRKIDPPNPVDWSVKNGWYVDLATAGERVNVDMQLAFNVLTAAGNIPGGTATDCEAASSGTSWLYKLDVVSGSTTGSTKINSMVAGLSTVQLGSGAGITIVTRTDAQDQPPEKVEPQTIGQGTARRSSWRELTD